MIKPVEIEFLIKNGTRGTLEKITADVLKVGSDGSQSAAGASVAFEKAKLQAVLLQDVIENLEDKLKSMQSPDIDQTDNIADIENLKDKIDELKSHLLQVQEASENTQVVPPSMNVAQKKFDGLHFSIQQIAREMPTLAMGPQMFFLAISNNLPIFSDELARAKREYAELIKTGQKGTPVWKQVVKSLLSWQTAMTTGIMLLVMYGDKIVKSISDMTGWGVAARKKKEAAEQLAAAEKKMAEQTANAVTELEALSRVWLQLGNDMNAKITFINENASAFNKLGISINSVADAENLLIRNKQAFIEAQFAKAEGAVLAEMAADKYKDVLEKQKKLESIPKAYVQEKGTYTDAYGNKKKGMIMRKDSSWQKAEDELKEAEQAYDEAMNKVVEKQGKASEILKNANFNTIEEIKAGTIAWYKEQISLKQKHLDTLSVNDTAEIQAVKKQISAYQKILDDAQGRNSDKIPAQEKEYQKARISSIKDAKTEEMNLERSFITDKVKLIEFERDSKINAINDAKKAYLDKYGEKADTSGFDRQIEAINKQAEKKAGDVVNDELEENKKKINSLLEEYRTFDQRRRDIEESYRKDKEVLDNELLRKQTNNEDTSEIEASLKAREDAYRESMQRIQSEMLTSSDFYQRLFSSISEKGYSTLKNFYANAKEVIDSAKIGTNFVNIEIPELVDGNIVKKQVKVTVEEYQKMVKQMSAIGKQLEKDNPFKAVSNSFSKLVKDIKSGDKDAIADSMKSLDNAVGSTLNTMNQWGDSLGSIFGDQVGQAFDEIVQLTGGITDLGMGVGKIASGDILGGVTSALSGIGSIVQSLTSWREKEAQQQREWYLAELETNRLLDERNLKLAENRDTIADIIKDIELMNWLIKNGFSDKSSSSVWQSQYESYNKALENLYNERDRFDKLWGNVQDSNAKWSGKNGSLSWYTIEHSLKGMTEAEIELYYQQGKLSAGAKQYYEAWKASGEKIEELVSKIEELKESMREMVMGISFDGFLSNAKSALLEMRKDINSLGKFTEDTISEAIINAFMYKHMASVLEPLYNQLSDAFIDGTADKNFLEKWKETFQKTMEGLNKDLSDLEEVTGVDIDQDSTTTQSGKSGSFETMSQDQGTKLEGLFTASEMRIANIEETTESVDVQMSVAVSHLEKIEENTARCADELKEIKEDIKRINNDGLKVK